MTASVYRVWTLDADAKESMRAMREQKGMTVEQVLSKAIRSQLPGLMKALAAFGFADGWDSS